MFTRDPPCESCPPLQPCFSPHSEPLSVSRHTCSCSCPELTLAGFGLAPCASSMSLPLPISLASSDLSGPILEAFPDHPSTLSYSQCLCILCVTLWSPPCLLCICLSCLCPCGPHSIPTSHRALSSQCWLSCCPVHCCSSSSRGPWHLAGACII